MNKNIKVCLLDFDGTLVTEDMLVLITSLTGKLEESKRINDAFTRGEVEGLDALVSRINLLKGITNSQITELLDKNHYFMPGVHELMKFLKENKIITILASGNIPAVLEYYQKLLGIDYIVGSHPDMDGEKILGIRRESYPEFYFKKHDIKAIIDPMNLEKENIMAIGDGPGDKQMFELSGYNIAFNPQGGIEKFADVLVTGDLNKVVELLRNL